MSDRIQVATDGVVATLSLTGPNGVNTMDEDFFHDLADVVAGLEADDAVRAIVVRGTGGHFSYGLDLPALAPKLAGLRDAGVRERLGFRDYILRGQQGMRALAACAKPTIAAIDGWCIGGGLGLAAACDVRVAGPSARFSLREGKVGVVADMGSLQWLAGVVGEGHLRQLALTARDIDVAWAERIGLVNEVHADPDALFAAARELAEEMAANSPVVLRGIKDVLEDARRDRVDRGLRAVAEWNGAYLPGRDVTEALQAFAEGRQPVYVGA
ncbi:enoyl-CoA hydratase [Nocardioides sp. J9]|uniref:enoyl-CoA hydratase-related protein n=1 Tax=Nocardioides sp. J9 TaxID=935844 RepID=UPI00119FCEA0|nr:enoyl-CoA hydratase-related protein [Nocardioides sp. J9]TWH03657.1 enoyl-CoA hydratase [Nocardioides sp. J9]